MTADPDGWGTSAGLTGSPLSYRAFVLLMTARHYQQKYAPTHERRVKLEAALTETLARLEQETADV